MPRTFAKRRSSDSSTTCAGRGNKEAAKELKLFGLADFFTQRFARLSDIIYEQDVDLAKRRLGIGSLLSLVSTAGYYGAYAYVIWKTIAGRLSIGTFYFLTNAILQASSNIQQVFSTLSGIADQALFLTDLLAFFEMKPRFSRSRTRCLHRGRSNKDSNSGKSRLLSRHATPGSERLEFSAEPGERVALIGENGQGKTTIVKLITRLYDPTDGQILLDGIDLREYDLEDLYREIGVIFQDFMRYEMTARENIAVGKIEEIENQPISRTPRARVWLMK